MPSTIAMRMYCVNLLDMSYPRKFPAVASLADFRADATRFASPMLPLWNARHRTSLLCNAQCGWHCAFLARLLHQEQSRGKRHRHGEEAMSDTVNRQILLVEKPT